MTLSRSLHLVIRPLISGSSSGLMYQNFPQNILQSTIGAIATEWIEKCSSIGGKCLAVIFETTSTAAAAKIKHAIIPCKCQTSQFN